MNLEVVGPLGFEPRTDGLKVRCSTAELVAPSDYSRRTERPPIALTRATWHWGTEPYIYGARNDIYIIDLHKTRKKLEEAYESVLMSAGASFRRDTLDQRIINDVKNGTGRIIDVQGGFPHGTAFETTLHAWPLLKSVSAPADADQARPGRRADRALRGGAVSAGAAARAGGRPSPAARPRPDP